MSLLKGVFSRNSEIEKIYGIDLLDDIEVKSYLRSLALETCLNFIGRTISQSEFRMMKENKRITNDWDYLLNIRPNKDQSAAEFWHQLVYKMIDENEVLAIVTDADDLVIADSWSRVEYAVYQDVFTNVTVKGYTFKRSFKMDEVIYLTYSNERLSNFLNEMFSDYSDLFTRMIETQKLSNQIRGIVDIDSTQALDDKNQAKLQSFIDKLFKAFKSNVIALVPKLKGFSYNEVSSGENNGKSVEELAKLKRDLTNDVANILGIPISLIHGDMSEYETAIKAYIKFCIAPLIKRIQDEFNAKIISREDYHKGIKLVIRGVAEMNPLELAAAVDKLRASGTYSGNELRIKLGDEPVDNPALDEYVITKNYATVSKEGGEE